MLSKKASCDSHGQDSSYFLGWQEYEKNPYDPVQNPNGIIQMGLAENQLSFDLVESWLASNPDALELKRNGGSVFRELALFQDYHGFPAFKNELVEFMAEMRGNRVKFNPNKLVLTAGSTSANETLMFCLAEPGEAFLLPTPYYPGFDRDLKWRTGVEIVPIQCTSENGFKITAPALEEAYQRAQEFNLKVKGVLVTNPSNPLGTTMTTLELNHLIDFALAKEIHIISDEIYSGTVFNSPSFVSIVEAVTERNLEDTELWNRVHIVYSLSKDLGLPGFRENQKRLRKRRHMFVCGLKGAGIRCLKSNAGLFCWVDMRHLLKSNTFKAEKELWMKVVCEFGLNISPGSSCHCSEPGWFRMCFANMSEDTLEVAMQRVKALVEPTMVHESVVSKSTWLQTKWVFQLASYDREPDR
ncbi:hypothetical protein Pyn_11187 [Prunus yedoensis var. nudiflora]|uniref:Aminotransferase class I/classII large domain-containing protein n=1 Tax=Prunus yedoensis var. nudiflora TaxID=2094558 RepID=A0A314XMY2_PRUYE|nr:hypothetical protein Pyn_11187 [Prunus yedoensis var. nudiflora]